MPDQSPGPPPLAVVTATLLGVLIAGAWPASAQLPAPEEPTGPPLERIEAHLDRLRGQLQNAKMRLRTGIVSVDATHDGVASAAPLLRCCAQNLPRIEAAVRGIDLGLRDLVTCHQSDANDDARPSLELLRFDLDAMVAALRSLATAKTEGEASMVMDGTTRAFLNLEKSIAATPACDDGAPRGVTVLDPALRDTVRVAVIRAEPIRSGASDPALRRAIDDAAAALRAAHAGRTPGEIADLAAARRLYRAFGIDPTKTRPSSEALLRRVLRGDPVPSIAAPVDVSNLLALRFLLPNGLYDADRVEGEITIRRGAAGESYAGIRKGDVNVAGRPVVADARGACGNPTSDSARTAVTAATRRLVMVVFAPADYDPSRLAGHLDEARITIARHLAPPGVEVTTAGELLPGQ